MMLLRCLAKHGHGAATAPQQAAGRFFAIPCQHTDTHPVPGMCPLRSQYHFQVIEPEHMIHVAGLKS